MGRRGGLALPALALLGALLLPLRAMAQESEQAMMQVRLGLLYAENDPGAAAAQFRRVLEQNPSHYGATFQLAAALDRGGQPDQARTVWERMLRMAEAIGDGPTADQARARLAQEPLIQEALMKAGLDLLYPGNDPAAAAALFRQVLERNPTHYGATFQLARALDRAGEVAEARPLWNKVLEMAEGYNDAETAATARARLAR